MNKIRIERSSVPLADGLHRATVRTINPAQTGLMTHTEIADDRLDAFWSGVDAAGDAANKIGYDHIDSLSPEMTGVYAHSDPTAFMLGVNAVVRTWMVDGLDLPEA